MHNHAFIHQLLDLCQRMIPTNSSFNEPLFTVWKALRPLHIHEGTFFLIACEPNILSACFWLQNYSDVAGVPSVLCKISFCNLTWECCQICRLLSVSQVLSDITQSLPGAQITVQQPSKKQASQWCSLSSWAWNQGLKARTRYARYQIQFHCQPMRPDDTHWVSLSFEP